MIHQFFVPFPQLTVDASGDRVLQRIEDEILNDATHLAMSPSTISERAGHLSETAFTREGWLAGTQVFQSFAGIDWEIPAVLTGFQSREPMRSPSMAPTTAVPCCSIVEYSTRSSGARSARQNCRRLLTDCTLLRIDVDCLPDHSRGVFPPRSFG